MEQEITKEMIEYGLNQDVIHIRDSYHLAGCNELCCEIGGYAFYFTSLEDAQLTAKEYQEKYTEEEIIDQLYQTIGNEKLAIENGLMSNEFEFYHDILMENILGNEELERD